MDPGARALRRYGMAAVPQVAVVDARGGLAYIRPGVDADEVAEVLDRLTAARP